MTPVPCPAATGARPVSQALRVLRPALRQQIAVSGDGVLNVVP